jgi:hypothetical protein
MILSDDQQAFVNSLRDEDGRIEVDAVIAAAREPGCCLHELFEWDLQTAAEKYWTDRAQEIIRRVKVEITYESRIISSVCYVSEPDRPRTYIAVDAVRTQRAKSLLIVEQEISRAIGAMRRARVIALRLGFTREVDQAIADLDRLSEIVSRPAPRKPRGGGPKRPRPRGGGEARA